MHKCLWAINLYEQAIFLTIILRSFPSLYFLVFELITELPRKFCHSFSFTAKCGPEELSFRALHIAHHLIDKLWMVHECFSNVSSPSIASTVKAAIHIHSKRTKEILGSNERIWVNTWIKFWLKLTFFYGVWCQLHSSKILVRSCLTMVSTRKNILPERKSPYVKGIHRVIFFILFISENVFISSWDNLTERTTQITFTCSKLIDMRIVLMNYVFFNCNYTVPCLLKKRDSHARYDNL